MYKSICQQANIFKACISWIFLACMATIFLSSCLPLTQTYGDWTDQGVKVLGEGDYVNLWIDHKSYPSVPVILSEKSYAQNEFGEIYPIIVNPEEIRGYSKKNQIFLFLKGSNNSISKYKSWDDGFWTIYLKLKCDKEIYDKVVSFELDTFYYNPIFHGAPN